MQSKSSSPAQRLRCAAGALPSGFFENLESRTLLAADLAVTDLIVAPQTLGPGHDVIGAYDFSNIGDSDSGPFDVEVRLSMDQVWGNEDDIVLENKREENGMDPGEFESEFEDWSTPGDIAEGSYFLAVRLDTAGEVAENSEDNNTAWTGSAVISVVSGAPGPGDDDNGDGDDDGDGDNDDGDDSTPDIDVSGNGSDIDDDDSSASRDDRTFFGRVGVSGQFVDREFTLRNDGISDLIISDVRIRGNNAADFAVLVPPAMTVAPGATTTMVVRFDPNNLGTSKAKVVLVSNDGDTDDDGLLDDSEGDDGDFSFRVAGIGVAEATAAQVGVIGGGEVIDDDDLSAERRDDTAFGRVRAGSGSDEHVFTIVNNGNGELEIEDAHISGRDADEFELVDPSSNTLGPGQSATFIVRYSPDNNGASIADVVIVTNDAEGGAFRFRVRGIGSPAPAPIMTITGNGHQITDGDTTPRRSDRTFFGGADVTDGSRIRTFVIANAGNTVLDISGVTITGPGAAAFEFVALPVLSVAPGGTTTFRVRFDPAALGRHNATVAITSNDPSFGLFDFAIAGQGN